MWWFIGSGSAVIILTLLCVILFGAFAFIKKRVDTKQEELSKIGNKLEEKFGFSGIAQVFYKLGSGNLIGAIQAAKAFAKEWLQPEKLDELMLRIIKGAFKKLFQKYPEHRIALAKVYVDMLNPMLDDKDTEKIVEPALMERIAGFKLDNEMKAKLAILTGPLTEWGLERVSAIVMAIATENGDAAKMQIQAIASELMTDQGRRTAAKRVLRRLVPEFQENPDDAAYLAALVNGTAPPATAAKT